MTETVYLLVVKRISKKSVIILLLLIVLAAGLGFWKYQANVTQHKQAQAAAQEARKEAERARRAAVESKRRAEDAKKAEAARLLAERAKPPVTFFNKTKFSVDDPTSIWVIVNKQRPFNPRDYAPNDLVTPAVPLRSNAGGPEMKLRREAATALEGMVAAARVDNANLMIASAYRSFTTQTTIYDREVSQFGQATADTQSARPGHSEHQTGLGVDLEPTSRQCEIEDCFADTVEGKWLAANSSKYGFLLRYTAGKVGITGYRAEPWHFRYIGVELANEMSKQGIITLEEFFGLPAAPGY